MTTSIKTSRKFVRSLFAGSVLLLAVSAGMQTAAAADEPALARHVGYGDLDLESPKGVLVLLARLRLAAGEVCAPLASVDLTIHARWQECVNKALSAAVAKINNDALTAVYKQAAATPRG
jgi:UrcA family protein